VSELSERAAKQAGRGAMEVGLMSMGGVGL